MPAVFEFVGRVARAYANLAQSALADPETGLNGKLFYAGELDEDGRALVVAANIAGTASLVATGDRAAQKQAIRDGVADFLVNSLDEALRILKNQLRKRETVAVCLGLAPEAVEDEMRERGVLPDLLRSDVPIAPFHDALLFQKGEHDETDLKSIPALVVWSVDSARHKDLALLDEIALASLGPDEWAARRWLRLSPRYLGRLAQGLRIFSTHREFFARFSEQLRARVDRGEIAFPYEIRSHIGGSQWEHCFDPEKS